MMGRLDAEVSNKRGFTISQGQGIFFKQPKTSQKDLQQMRVMTQNVTDQRVNENVRKEGR